jgi:hypothetical protein
MNMESPDLNQIHQDPVEEVQPAVPGAPKVTPEFDSTAANTKQTQEAAGEVVKFSPAKFDKTHNVVDVVSGNCTVKTMRLDENDIPRMIGSPQEFKEGEKNQVFYEKGFYYRIEAPGMNPVNVSFTEDELKALQERPQDPQTQKMVLGKALAAQVKAIDDQASK